MERTKIPKSRNGSKVGFEPGLSRLRVRHSTTELPHSTVTVLLLICSRPWKTCVRTRCLPSCTITWSQSVRVTSSRVSSSSYCILYVVAWSVWGQLCCLAWSVWPLGSWVSCAELSCHVCTWSGRVIFFGFLWIRPVLFFIWVAVAIVNPRAASWACPTFFPGFLSGPWPLALDL